MPKWKGSYDDGRTYIRKWEQSFAWVKKSSDGSENAWCKLCRVTIAPKISRLKDHEKSKRHSSLVGATAKTQPLQVVRTTRESQSVLKKIEIELAVALSCHSPIYAADHLGEIIKRNGNGSKLENIQLHRTKCSKIIAKVVAPALLDDLKKDVAGKKFAVLIDESTDLSTAKHLCIIIRYFSVIKSEIVTAFVGLIPLVEATAQAIFEIMKNALEGIGLNMEDCVGLGCDGAASMVGHHNSVWTRIKQISPHCILNRCMCHSLALCISKAFGQLPSNLGYIITEVPKWFSKSCLRRDSYKELYKVMNPDEDYEPQMPFKKISTTRWLVRGKVISNILFNWEELKAYFICVLPHTDASCRYKAREILNMLEDGVNKLYFQFVSPVVTEFERVNSLFQATDIDPLQLEQELSYHHQSLRKRVRNDLNQPLPLDAVDFGIKFLQETEMYVTAHGHSAQASTRVQNVKMRCANLLNEALAQVEARISHAAGVYRSLSFLSPKKVLSQTDRAAFKSLPMPDLRSSNETVIEEQYRKILHVSWADEPVFDGEISNDTVEFWTKLFCYKVSTGQHPFKELSFYALTCLTTPVSNAVVERIFSMVANVKNKVRNRLGTKMLESIIRIRTVLQFKEKCCKDFVVSPQMLHLFNSENLYQSQCSNISSDLVNPAIATLDSSI